MLRGKLISLNVYIRKKNKTNNPRLYFKKIVKVKQNIFKLRRRKEIIIISTEINKIENRLSIVKTNKTKRYFLAKINNINKHLARVSKKRREGTQIINIKSEMHQFLERYNLSKFI